MTIGHGFRAFCFNPHCRAGGGRPKLSEYSGQLNQFQSTPPRTEAVPDTYYFPVFEKSIEGFRVLIVGLTNAEVHQERYLITCIPAFFRGHMTG